MKKQSKKKKQIIALVIIIAIISLSVFFEHKAAFSGKTIAPSKSPGSTNPVIITKENFPAYLQNNQIVKDLPKDAVISLRFYNFDAGERQWEESYIIRKGEIKLGEAENSDINIILDSKYIPEVYNLCNALKQARNNGDFGYELNKNKASLLWKYKGMMKYKECLGI